MKWNCGNLPKCAETAGAGNKETLFDTIQKVLETFKFPFYYFKSAIFQSQNISLALQNKEYWPVTTSAWIKCMAWLPKT